MARLVDVPMARMFVLIGLIFLLVAVLGKIEGKIAPGNSGRIGASIVGFLLLAAGLGMYFVEGEMIRGELRESLRSMSAQPRAVADRILPRPAVAAQGSAGDPPAIQVVAASYGANCGSKPGNATSLLARACDGRAMCDTRIDVSALEDAAPECDKNFMAEWKCGTAATIYGLTVAPGKAREERLRLTCTSG